MSIAPPSDIILDVAQAADPQRLQAATQKLAAMAAGAAGPSVDFASLIDGAAASGGKPASAALAASTRIASAPSPTHPAASPYRKFEAVLLQTMVQEMLPKDDALYGDASSADAVRSMLAEQLAGQLSKSGAFGIARMVEKAEAARQAAAAQGSIATPSVAPSSVAPVPTPRDPAVVAATAPELVAPATISSRSIAL